MMRRQIIYCKNNCNRKAIKNDMTYIESERVSRRSKRLCSEERARKRLRRTDVILGRCEPWVRVWLTRCRERGAWICIIGCVAKQISVFIWIGVRDCWLSDYSVNTKHKYNLEVLKQFWSFIYITWWWLCSTNFVDTMNLTWNTSTPAPTYKALKETWNLKNVDIIKWWVFFLVKLTEQHGLHIDIM